MNLPLQGIRVLDWTIWQQGPCATAMLGDLGAEVIKIEAPVGDPGREVVRRMLAALKIEADYNFYFEYLNRNKKGLALDLKQPEARRIIYRLAAESDVFVQNYRKGVAERLGLGYDDLKEHNPKIIYATASGYGPEGPDSAEPSFDYMGLARSGIMTMVGGPETPPSNIVGGVADQMGGIMLAYGVMTAIVARERFGMGQKVDTSHLGSMMHLQGLNVQASMTMGQTLTKSDREDASSPLWNHYKCGDGKWICLGMLDPDRYWPGFCRVMGIQELENDPKFKDMVCRAENANELVTILDDRFAAKPRDEWMKLLKEGGDFIYTVVNDITDLPSDPQVRDNNYITSFDHQKLGTINVMGFPFGLSETPGGMQCRAPELSEHTEEILSDICGFSSSEIEKFREQEIIGD
jgi:crotonobetainyl-CoA:carnitine CoA-transferase CaiB-like acyl-CoA transferase